MPITNDIKATGNSGTGLEFVTKNVFAESSNNCEFLSIVVELLVKSSVYWFPLFRK